MAGYDYEATTRQGEKREPGSIWHIFHRDVYGDLVRYLQRSRNTTVHPIQQRNTYFNRNDLEALKSERNVEPMVIVQGVGDVVVVPASMPHQVCNVSNTIKLAVDFGSPFNATEV